MIQVVKKIEVFNIKTDNAGSRQVSVIKKDTPIVVGKRECVSITNNYTGQYDTFNSGADVHSGRVAAMIDGLIYEADVTDKSQKDLIVGLILNNAERNYPVNICRGGKVSNLGGLTPGVPYFFDSVGVLTTTPPAQGIFMSVGFAKSDSEFIVKISTPTWRP